MEVKDIIISGLNKMFCKEVYKSSDTKEVLLYRVGRWFNFVDDKTIRGNRLECVKNILRENNINFTEEKIYISWSSGYVSQIVLK